ncbi:MAG TPA: TIGR04219 family outer membrane beta-barrel protein [Dongiaceae bacterium]|nr:TIGR04219 family outer membrane beta-barrel protein [Dongiaceae bacterium]
MKKTSAIKISTLALLGVTLSSPVLADDPVRFMVGGGSLNFDVSGTFADVDSGGSDIDLEKDLGLDGGNGTYIYVAVEHGIPLLPNVRLAYTELEDDADTRLDSTIVVDGLPFPEDTFVRSEADLSHTDLTLYYEVLDDGVNLDLGVTARQFDGGISITGYNIFGTLTATQSLDTIVPLLYGAVQFDLPIRGLYVAADGSALAFDGSSFYDLWLKAGYVFSFGLGLELGYRKIDMQAEDVEGTDADITLDGQYLALVFAF